METRPSTLKARIFNLVGWGARIPKPVGPHLVRSFHFRIPEEHGVMSQVFFPVHLVEQESNVAPKSTTIPVKRVYRNGVIKEFSYFSSTPKFLFDLFLGASPHPLADVPEHAKPFVRGEGAHSMPLILFSHGLGGNCEVYTKACSDLAANGYIVVALEHEDGSGSFARSITGDVVKYQRPPQGMEYTRENVIAFRAPFLKKREMEVRRALDFFTLTKDYSKIEENMDLMHCLQSIDPSKVFLAGHSFGGASTVHTIREMPDKFIGVILMDLWSFPIPNLADGVKNVPLCSVLSADFERSKESFLTAKLLGSSNQVTCNFYVPGSVHSSFSDTPYWAPSWLALRFNLRGAIDPLTVQNSLNQVYVAFIEEVLNNLRTKDVVLEGAANSKASLQERLLERDPLLRPFKKSAN